jgi:hypothetical protein
MDNNKIDIPQVFVSYPAGTGGEWLVYQIGQHDKYYQFHEGEMELTVNEYNRCRITGSWRQKILDDTDFKDDVWLPGEYDNSAEWWHDYWHCAGDNDWYNRVRKLVSSKPRYRIPVHRCHEAWQEIIWRDLFTEFKIVTLTVDRNDPAVWQQYKGNIIKKIWWQDLSDEEDLKDEMYDKYKKLYKRREQKGQPEDLLKITRKFSGDVNYTDMMFALYYHELEDADAALNKTLENMSERWNEYNTDQHNHPIPDVDHLQISYGDMFVYRKRETYLKLCEFLDTAPWSADSWSAILNEYADADSITVLTEDDVMRRIQHRVSELC